MDKNFFEATRVNIGIGKETPYKANYTTFEDTYDPAYGATNRWRSRSRT